VRWIERLADGLVDVLLDETGADVVLDDDGALDDVTAARWAQRVGAPVPRDVEFGVREALTAHGVLVDGRSRGPRLGQFTEPGEFRRAVLESVADGIREEIAAGATETGPAPPDVEGELPVRFLRAFDALTGNGIVRLTAAGRLRACDVRELGRLLPELRDPDRLRALWELLVARHEILVSAQGAEVHPAWRVRGVPAWAPHLVADSRLRPEAAAM
jgi:hypothetical protein